MCTFWHLLSVAVSEVKTTETDENHEKSRKSTPLRGTFWIPKLHKIRFKTIQNQGTIDARVSLMQNNQKSSKIRKKNRDFFPVMEGRGRRRPGCVFDDLPRPIRTNFGFS